MRLSRCILAITLVTLSASAEPSAADKQTARALMDAGDSLIAKGDAPGALKAFSAAHAIMDVPSTGLEVARTQAGLRLWVEAIDTCLQVGRIQVRDGEPAVFAEARRECAEIARKADKQTASLRLKVTGPTSEQATIRIDGNVVPPAAVTAFRKMNPGSHTIAGTAQGYRDATTTVLLREGDDTEAVLAFQRIEPSAAAAAPASTGSATGPAPRPAPSRAVPTGAYVGFGLAAAGVSVGAVTGYLAFSEASKAKEACIGDRCPRSAAGSIDASRSMGTISTVAFAVATVGIGIGIYSLVTAKSETQVGLVVGPGSVGATGRFLAIRHQATRAHAAPCYSCPNRSSSTRRAAAPRSVGCFAIGRSASAGPRG